MLYNPSCSSCGSGGVTPVDAGAAPPSSLQRCLTQCAQRAQTWEAFCNEHAGIDITERESTCCSLEASRLQSRCEQSCRLYGSPNFFTFPPPDQFCGRLVRVDINDTGEAL